MSRSAKHHSPQLESGSERPVSNVGTILRGARLSRDEELRDVAAALRIRLPYLEAIEEGRIDDLPGVTYGIGFVRAYSDYMGLDTADIVAKFKGEASSINRRTHLHFPEPLPGNRVPGVGLLIFVFVLAAAVYGGWLYASSKDMTFADAVEAVPASLRALISDEEMAQATADPVPEPQVEPAPPPGPVVQPAEDQTSATAISEQPPEEPAAAPEAAPVEDMANQEAPADAVPAEAPAVAQESVPPPAVQPEEAAIAEAPTSAAAVTEPPAETVPASPEVLPEPPAPPPAVEVTESPATQSPAVENSVAENPVAENPAVASPVAESPLAESSEPVTGSSIVEEDLPPPAPEPPASSETAAVVSSTPEAVAETAPAEAPAAVTPAESSASNDVASDAAANRIIIQATAESWIKVQDAAGKVLIEKLMLMGEIYRVPDRPGLVLDTGNAGALKLIVNGTVAPPLGTSGEIRRNIELTADALLH